MTRRVGRLGTIRVNGDVVFVGGALVRQIMVVFLSGRRQTTMSAFKGT
jgi:hypothetical protein